MRVVYAVGVLNALDWPYTLAGREGAERFRPCRFVPGAGLEPAVYKRQRLTHAGQSENARAGFRGEPSERQG